MYAAFKAWVAKVSGHRLALVNERLAGLSREIVETEAARERRDIRARHDRRTKR